MIWAILGLGTLFRLISLNQSLWLDEAINIQAAKSFSLVGMVTQYAVADFHPPGWFIILWSWGKLFGYSEIAARLPSVFFGILTVYITYLIGKKLVSKNLGLLAAFLLTVNPLHIYYSQEARMYSLATMAVALNIFLLTKIEKFNITFLIVSNLLVLLSDYIAYFIFPAQFIFLLFFKKKEFFKKWLVALGIAMLFFILWLPVFLRQLDVGATASANLPTWKFVTGTFDFKTLPLTFVKFIIGRISIANKITYTAVLLPICLLFALLLLKGLRSVKDLPKKLLLSWIATPLLVAMAVSIVVPVYNYFRVLYIIPAFIILISLGILTFKKLRYILFGLVFLVELFSTLVYLLNPLYQREDWKGLVGYFNNVKPEVILFESSGTLPPFDYYADGNLNAKGALKDFPAKDDLSVSGLDDSYKEVYLVDYLVEISDPKRFVAGKLKTLGFKEAGIKDFHGVGFVYHYVK